MPFEAILDSLDEGVITVDDAGNMVGINHAACEILEADKTKALRQGCLFLFGDNLCAPTSPIRVSIANGQPIHDLEIDVETESGHRKLLNVRTNVFRDEKKGIHGGLIVFRDVTELARLRRDLVERYRLHNIIGKSKPMRDVFRLIEQVADSDATVLIEGETGTGKELVARAIHHLGPRAAGPLIPVNCSALSEGLLESELFGHVRGAFTGALRNKRGRFEAAVSGTIFLDEIGEVSAGIQVKLLRVLQEHTIERVGDERPVPVDIRVIAASNHPLAELTRAGRFREDLYYRLHVLPIQLPPLRQRRDDIPLLAQHFVNIYRAETGRAIERIDQEALSIMVDYDWPGNVRELENSIEYSFVKTTSGLISSRHLPPEVLPRRRRSSPAVAPQRRSRRADLTRERIRRELTAAGWNVAKAARRLRMSRTTLYGKMSEYELREPLE